ATGARIEATVVVAHVRVDTAVRGDAARARGHHERPPCGVAGRRPAGPGQSRHRLPALPRGVDSEREARAVRTGLADRGARLPRLARAQPCGDRERVSGLDRRGAAEGVLTGTAYR